MPAAKIDIGPIIITLTGALHVGAGHARGLIDRAVVRDGRGRIYIPGSSLKGKTREACERLARLHGLTVCEPPYTAGMCGARGGPCIICRIFGTPGGRSNEAFGLYWDNSYLTEQWVQAGAKLGLSYARTQVSMSQRRGIGREGLLFTDEFAAEGLTFQTRISGHLDLTAVLGEPRRYYELILLLGGLRLVETLGGSTSRGAGRCEIKLPPCIVVTSSEYGTETLSVDVTVDRVSLLDLYAEEMAEGGA